MKRDREKRYKPIRNWFFSTLLPFLKYKENLNITVLLADLTSTEFANVGVMVTYAALGVEQGYIRHRLQLGQQLPFP